MDREAAAPGARAPRRSRKSTPEEALPEASPLTAPGAQRIRQVAVEATIAAVVFAALCFAVLSVAPQFAEPDDGAYHHSIVGITMGYYLTLSTSQIDALDAKSGSPAGQITNQWVELPNGRYISEKDPGYPFLAAPFQAVGLIRWAPLFYGALACLGLFLGARRWLGRFGGLAAVGLFCSSGAALAFAWRDYMPTFTDASLVAAGSGVLLWMVLAADASPRRRTWAGLAGFVAIEVGTFVRYTNIVVLGCAVVALVVAWRTRATRLPFRTLGWCLATVALFGAGVAGFDQVVYGGPLTTGYAPGEVTFSLDAVGTNVRTMTGHLIYGMPMLALGLIALTWIILRWVVLRRARGQRGPQARLDICVSFALAATWFAIWGLYSAYTWTTDPTNFTVQDVRFYLPAIGAISLLGSWLVSRIPGRAWVAGLTSTVVIAVLFALGDWTFHAMYAAFSVPLSG